MRAQGRGHGFASWRLSILADNEGEFVEAMKYGAGPVAAPAMA